MRNCPKAPISLSPPQNVQERWFLESYSRENNFFLCSNPSLELQLWSPTALSMLKWQISCHSNKRPMASRTRGGKRVWGCWAMWIRDEPTEQASRKSQRPFRILRRRRFCSASRRPLLEVWWIYVAENPYKFCEFGEPVPNYWFSWTKPNKLSSTLAYVC